MSVKLDDVIDEFNCLLKEIDSLVVNDIDIGKKITELDSKLKTNAQLRNSIANEFYKTFKGKLQASLLHKLDKNVHLLTKCLKNSAAAFKSDLDADEYEICQSLIGYLNCAIDSNEESLDLNVKNENDEVNVDEDDAFYSDKKTKHSIYQNVFQYFFNLTQGNKKAYDEFKGEWVSICFKLFKRPNLSMDLFNLSSMLLAYGCLEKQKVCEKEELKKNLLFTENQSLNLNDYFNMLDNTFHLVSIKYLNNENLQIDNDEELFDQLINETIQIWPFKLCQHYFDYFYFNDDKLISGCSSLDQIRNRLNLFKMLKFNLFKLMNSKNKANLEIQKYYSIKNLDFILKNFDSALISLLKKIDENFGEENENTIIPSSIANFEFFYVISDHFNEVKLLVRCLSDILTSEDNESFSKTNLAFAQKHENILANICVLFHQIHVNDRLNKYIRESTEKLNPKTSFIDAKQQKANYTNPYFNLKCEVVRLIGILVYNNKFNQNLLANYKVLHLISNNLNIDFDNPFIREWSLVALKHILSCLDLKQ